MSDIPAIEKHRFPRPLSGFAVKLIAIVCMVIDHAGLLLVTGPAEYACRAIGRIAFPLFCFLLVEGLEHTKSVPKYLARLGLFAVACEPIYDYAFFRQPLEWADQNIFLTLFLGLAMIALVDRVQRWAEERKKHGLAGLGIVLWVQLLIFAVFAYLADFLKADYGIYGLGVIAVFYLFRRNPLLRAVVFSLAVYARYRGGLPMQYMALVALIPIALYNGKRGPKLKYSFYVFYPLHLAILAWIMVVPLTGIGAVTDANRAAALQPLSGFMGSPYEQENGTPELVYEVVHDTSPWGEFSRGLVLAPEESTGERYAYADVFMSNGAALLLGNEAGEGFSLWAGDRVTVSFAVSPESLEKNHREDVTMVFFPARDGMYLRADEQIQKDSGFTFSFTAPEQGMYWFGVMNGASDKVVIEQITLSVDMP